MMGLDDMGELEMPADLFGPAYRGVGGSGGGGMSEEEMLAAAIQASLNDLNINGAGPGASAGQENAISQESYDYLSAYAGGESAQSEPQPKAAQNPIYKDPFADDPFARDPFDVPDSIEPQQKPGPAASSVQVALDLIDISEPGREKSAFETDGSPSQEALGLADPYAVNDLYSEEEQKAPARFQP